MRYPLGNNVRDITYDAGDRITAYTHYDASTATATAIWTIVYDANGNRTSVTQNTSTSAYTTETTSNRLTSLTNPTRSLSYNNVGNII